MLLVRPPPTEQAAANPKLAARRDFIHHLAMVCGTASACDPALEAVPAKCARNEIGAELLIEDSN
jgi:hypothetical protein